MTLPLPKPSSLPPKDVLRQEAIAALRAVMNDAGAVAAARAGAARTVLESLGDIGRLQELARTASKPLNEMSPTEIDEEIARLRPTK